MPRLYGERPQITRQPDQQSGLAVRLHPMSTPAPEAEPTPAPEPAGDCECDINGIFWSGNGTYWPGTDDVYNLTAITLFNLPPDHAMPKAALLGDTCPGADTTGINASWAGGSSPPTYEIVEVDQNWALVVTEMYANGNGNGTLTISGSIVCNGDTINVGPITLTIAFEGGGG